MGALAAFFVLMMRFRLMNYERPPFVARVWLRPDGLDVAVPGRYAVTYRYVPWPEVVGFGIEAPDANGETGPQGYVDLVAEDSDVAERVRIGSVTPDFPVAVRHYSAGAHEVTWPAG